MSFSNRTTRALARLERAPAFLRGWLRERAIGRTIPFVGTAGIRIEVMEAGRVRLRLPNRRAVQNHIGGVHAAATALLAETASGLIVGLNVPDSAVPVIRSMQIDYLRRARGALRAEALLDPAQVEAIRGSDSGDIEVPVTVSDEDGEAPVACRMLWAWRPRRETPTGAAGR
jgi:uncharacterized protein (TIGR00369 family)